MGKRRDAETELNLPPGFRFHPTDEELVVHYLCRKASHQSLPVPIIAEVDLYKYDPWQLPEKALFGKKEWYFFTPRDRKYPNGSRPNRAAGSGYWKATGADKPIRPTGSTKHVAIKKALVFYTGKAPKGVKTNWIMHEYRFTDSKRSADKDSLKLDEWVLCRLYNKKNDCEKEHQAKEESVEESMDSYDPIKEARSDRIPESDIDNDLGGAPHCQSQALAGAQRMSTNEGGHFNEDHGWFAGLNLEDLKNSLSAYGGSQIPDFMYNGFYFGAEPVLDISGVGRRLEPQIEMAPHSFKLFIYQSS